jgi:hypothetical protein
MPSGIMDASVGVPLSVFAGGTTTRVSRSESPHAGTIIDSTQPQAHAALRVLVVFLAQTFVIFNPDLEVLGPDLRLARRADENLRPRAAALTLVTFSANVQGSAPKAHCARWSS